MAKVLSGAGLRGQVAGKTALSTVGVSGSGLTYRGYDVKDLAEKCEFEEVAYLILKGTLPTADQLAAYKTKLQGLRGLPEALKDVLERIPKDAHPMDVLRTGSSMLGNLEMEADFSEQQQVTDRMLACFPSIICYWYRFSRDGVRIDVETDDDSMADISCTFFTVKSRMHCMKKLCMYHLFFTLNTNLMHLPLLRVFVHQRCLICILVLLAQLGHCGVLCMAAQMKRQWS